MVLRCTPVAVETSATVIFRPNSFSLSFQKENSVTFTIDTHLYNSFINLLLTFLLNYANIVIARSLNVVVTILANIPHFGINICPDCNVQWSGSQERNRGNFISQNERNGKGRNPLTVSDHHQGTGGPKRWLLLFYTLPTYLGKKHNPKLRQLKRPNQDRFYFTPTGGLLAS